MTNKHTLIIGANSEIAKAIAEQILADDQYHQLTLVSRNLDAYQNIGGQQLTKITIADYEQNNIIKAVDDIQSSMKENITQVFICLGVLHNQTVKPEKRLEDFKPSAFESVLKANALTPILWIKNLTPLLTCKTPCKVTVFSARVGSISDNHLGGWYSYRASKAALNMMLKTAAIELARRAKNIKLIAFHPGTTDTPLSKPFQNNVPVKKLFTSSFVASQLLNILSETKIDGEASFLDWQGKAIEW